MKKLRYLILAAVFCCITAEAQAQVDPVRNFNPVEASANTQAMTSSDGNDPLDLRKDKKLNELLGWDTFTGINGPVYVTAIHNGYLYIGGRFTQIGTVAAKGIARFNLTTSLWSALGTEPNSGVYGLDAGTNFVNALAFDGNNVYVGGQFFFAGGITARRIAVWNSSTNQWSALGGGFYNGAVLALQFYNSKLVAGGTFDYTDVNNSQGTSLNCLAQWDGTSWTSLGGGVKTGTIRTAVMALAVKSSGSKTGLYVGGNFTTAGAANLSTKHVAHWDGSSWSALGTGSNNGVGSGTGSATFVSALGFRGDNVYVGGNFTSVAGSAISNANRIARYNVANNTWYKLGNGVGNSSQTYSFSQLNNASTGPFVATIEFCDTVMNNAAVVRFIYVGGFFQSIGNTTANGFARAEILNLNGTITWSHNENGVTHGAPVSVVFSFAKQGSILYLGGQFGRVNSSRSTTHLARWYNLCTPPAAAYGSGGGTGGGWRQGAEEEAAESEEPAVNFQLGQNRPNPFSELSKVDFSLAAPSHVALTLFNGLGVPVMKLMDAEMPAGDHNVSIDGTTLSAGVYYYRLQTSAGSMTRQLVITK